jgi:FMN phosphatase YigB (HAD superfamily)
MLGGASTKAQLLADLKECPLTLVAFSNAPRKYVRRVLVELGIFELFADERLFAVEDCLPHCKPEREAFDKIFDKLGISAHECVMVEDSMKNIRRAKQLGVRTCLVSGAGRLLTIAATKNSDTTRNEAEEAEATKPDDAPVWNDPAVDLAIEIVEELRKRAPGLWLTPATFP